MSGGLKACEQFSNSESVCMLFALQEKRINVKVNNTTTEQGNSESYLLLNRENNTGIPIVLCYEINQR